VDLVGEIDAVTLILEPAGDWSVVVSRVPRQVAALDGKTLAEALQRVMR
jgi:predicted RNase H-like HicB family nuclease